MISNDFFLYFHGNYVTVIATRKLDENLLQIGKQGG